MRKQKKIDFNHRKTTKKSQNQTSAKPKQSKSKHIIQIKIFNKNNLRHHSPHQTSSFKSVSKSSCKGLSIQMLSVCKTKVHISPNPETQVRKSTPCIHRDSSSIQNNNQRQISLKNKFRSQLSKGAKPIQKKEEISVKKKNISLKSFQNQNFHKRNTFDQFNHKNNKIQTEYNKTFAKNLQYQRLERKSAQILLERLKIGRKNKNSKHHQQDKKIEYRPNDFHKQKKYQSKSSCITRNISRNNSKEKHNQRMNQQLEQKFKKKQNRRKKLKKEPIYASMKISKRNSFRFFETDSNQYILVQQMTSQNPSETLVFSKKQNQELPINFSTVKSLKRLDFLIDNFVDMNETKNRQFGSSKQKSSKQKEFSFELNDQIKKGRDGKIHQISIDNFLENSQQQFHLQCEESLKQRLTNNYLSLQQLKEQQFPNKDQIHWLNEFQNLLENQKLSQTWEMSKSPSIFLSRINFPQDQGILIKRIEIIDWISILSSTMLLKTQTFQLAIAFFDLFIFGKVSPESIQINNNQYFRLISIACLTLAIKMDERELQHDIFNVFITLDVGFDRIQISEAERTVVKKIKLQLKIETLSVWLDFLLSEWDVFLNNSSFHQKEQLRFKSVEGKSYENYQKTVQMMNSILLDGGIFIYQCDIIILSIILVVLEENLQALHRQKVFEQIKNFKVNYQKRFEDQKETLLYFTTQQTLDQLGLSDCKENNHYDCKKDNQHDLKVNNQYYCKIQSTQSQSSGERNSCNRGKYTLLRHNLSDSKANLMQIFKDFAKINTNRKFEDLEKAILYVGQFSKLKFVLEIQTRVYEEARTYEQFIRYHSYSPHLKTFALRRVQEFFLTQDKKRNIDSEVNAISIINN